MEPATITGSLYRELLENGYKNLAAHFQAINDLNGFMNERWKGMQPVAWGDNLAEAQLTATIYQGMLGVDRIANERRIEYYEI